LIAKPSLSIADLGVATVNRRVASSKSSKIWPTLTVESAFRKPLDR
jgi:hypothetical protein